MDSENKSKVELRSEKIRNIIGMIPPRLLRMGIYVVLAIILTLLLCSYYFPYPQYKECLFTLYTSPIPEEVTAIEPGVIYFNPGNNILREDTIGFLVTKKGQRINYISSTNGKLITNYSNGDFVNSETLIYIIYPETVNMVYGLTHILSSEIDFIELGQKTIIFTDRMDIIGHITKIYPFVENEKYKIRIEIKESADFSNYSSIINTGIQITGKILISNKPILKRIFDIE